MEDCTNCQKEHTFRLEKIEKKLEEREKYIVDQTIKIEKIDEATKSAHKRLDELIENIGDTPSTLIRFTIAIEGMTKDIKELVQSIKEHDSEIEKLQRIPLENAHNLQKIILSYLLIALLGIVLGKFGVKI